MKVYLCSLCGVLAKPKPAKLRFPGLGWNRLMSQSSAKGKSIRRVNELGIQMLSKPLYEQLFQGTDKKDYTKEDVKRSIEHLKEQELWGSSGTRLPDIDAKLPPMYGQDIDKHFRIIAGVQSQDYLDLAMQLIRTKLCPMPTQWVQKEGWTKYDPKTGEGKSVSCPSDAVMVLDVETCVTDSHRPILAVAVSPRGWYSWVSKRLCSPQVFSEEDTHFDELIPLEKPKGRGTSDWTRSRLVVGHNVSYDRARIKEQYLIDYPNTKFLDTLSLHVCVAGQTTNQKGIWLSHKKKMTFKDSVGGQSSMNTLENSWIEVSSPNNLVDVHELYVKNGQEKISKVLRDVFVKGSIQDIHDDFQNLTCYCAHDVLATHELLEKLLPLYLTRSPHPVSFAGMLDMGLAYLPVNSSWKQYTADSDYIYQEMEREMKSKLIALANEACSWFDGKRFAKCTTE